MVANIFHVITNLTSIGPPGLGGVGQPERGQGS